MSHHRLQAFLVTLSHPVALRAEGTPSSIIQRESASIETAETLPEPLAEALPEPISESAPSSLPERLEGR